MTELASDPLAELRHALANPLSALIAEVQLALMGSAAFDEETRQSLHDIEALALRMRAIMKDSRPAAGAAPIDPVEETS